MAKIIVLGSNGMAGHVISAYLRSMTCYEVIDVCRSSQNNADFINIDVRDFRKVQHLLKKEKPDVIINCVGILNKFADLDIADTIYINAYFPHLLEKNCSNSKTKIIHLSTDCVFSGITGNNTEKTTPDSSDLYGRTKALGEIINNKDLTIRTSIIGPELKDNGTGLFHWFMSQSGCVQGYSSVIWTGITTLQLAISIEQMINSNISGLYHLVPSTSISKFDLINLINSVFEKKINILQNDDIKSDKSLVNTRNDYLFNIPDYKEMILELKCHIESNPSIYSKYLN